MKTILSGVKPTGTSHIGNYFGAMRQFVELQNSNEGGFFMIADYHALNFIQNKEEMRSLTTNLLLDYLAIGLDPKRSVIFKQSDVSEHTELAWIFDTITTVPYLKRAHAYKDAVAKGGEENVSVGTFNYPMLMAADILLYSPDIVPVGQDQKQHIEFARDTAEKFNRIFNQQIFKLPEPYILEGVETIPGIDGRKMSKSYNNTIPLFAENEEMDKLVMSIVTDSGGDIPENVYAIHKLFANNDGSTELTTDKLQEIYQENKGQYKKLKEILAEDIKKFFAPMKNKRDSMKDDKDLLTQILQNGKEKAAAVAAAKMSEVKSSIGLS